MTSTTPDPVAVRVQNLLMKTQVLVLLDLACSRTSGRASPADIVSLFDALGLPRPGNTSAALAKLEKGGLVSRSKGSGGVWRPTPNGKVEIGRQLTGLDSVALQAEAENPESGQMASMTHPTLRPSLAPPELVRPLAKFLDEHPFDRNVFGMTRFPSAEPKDLISDALEAARSACLSHGLEFHLASDRAIVDDLWSNVAGHMWASQFGIAFIEKTSKRGMNYNLTIEIGSMLMAGRRIALLKDKTVSNLPSDLTGKIYREVDPSNPETVVKQVHAWLSSNRGLGKCAGC
jgi:hypothetical protein